MTNSFNLKPGMIFSNADLCEMFECQEQGGIRLSVTSKAIVIVNNHIKSIYRNQWINNKTLLYVGEGLQGDQSISRGNKALNNAKEDDKKIYLFEVYEDREYTFIDEVVLTKDVYFENAPDENHNIRQVIIFNLQLVNVEYQISDVNNNKIRLAQSKILNKYPDDQLYKIAKTRSQKQVRTVFISSNSYIRDTVIAEWSKRHAKGICQLCDQPAPFKGKDGKPYLESHHIDWLSNGGEDSIKNTIALCPNCHRKMHIVNDDSDIKKLKAKNAFV